MISIALATYNGEQYLREQLDSIYSQTIKDFEVIVTDDCSTDSTAAILEEYHQRFGLTYIINSERLGFVRNFEKAISLCSGDYIALCDQDDIWLPDKLEVLLGNIKNHSLCCSDACLIDSHGDLITGSVYTHSGLTFYKQKQFNYLIHDNFVMGCTMLFKKELLELILPFPVYTTYHDWWISIAASLKNGICFVDKPLIKYRFHGENQSSTAMSVSNIIAKLREVSLQRKSGYYDRMVEWLSAIKLHPSIKAGDLKVVNQRIDFYKSMNTGIIHFKAFIVALKNRRYMFSRRSRFMRIIYAFAALFI